MKDYRAPRATLADVVNRLLMRFTRLHHQNLRSISFETFERGRSLMLWIANRAGMDTYDTLHCNHELYRLANDLPFLNYLETVKALELVMQRIDEEAGRYRPREPRRAGQVRARTADYVCVRTSWPHLREPVLS